MGVGPKLKTVLQFMVFFFFIGVTLFLITIVIRGKKQKALIKFIEAQGGEVFYEFQEVEAPFVDFTDTVVINKYIGKNRYSSSAIPPNIYTWIGIDNFYSVNCVYLSDVDVQTIVESIEVFGNLECLTLDSCSHRDLGTIPKLTRLTELTISNSKCKELDTQELSSLSNLRFLKLDYTDVSAIPKFETTNVLEYLLVSGTGIESLEDLDRLDRLKCLCINNTNIDDLSPIQNLRNLSLAVEFDNCPVEDIRPVLNAYLSDDSAELSFYGTNLKDFSLINEFAPIEVLDCSQTEIQFFSGVNKRHDVRVLLLSYSKLRSLEGIESFSRTNRLYLAGTLIDDLSPLSQLNELAYLNLSGSSLKTTATLPVLQSLEELDLTGCRLLQDLRGIENLRSLRSLSISGTAVSLLPLSALPLKELHIAEMDVSQEEIKHLLSRNQSIRRLTIRKAIFDNSLEDLPKRFPSVVFSFY